jgi:tRNA threonylcarbamoyladenosine biosynthesis protein TsaE
MIVESASEADTLSAGQRLAGLLRPGDVILLAGELGSGKTIFTCGVAEGLGVAERVTSPSFVLVRRYRGFLPLTHADAYRLGTMAELEDLGLDDREPHGVLIVEWGDAVASGLPADHLTVRFEVMGPEHRILSFVPSGSWRSRSLEGLAP